MGTRINLISRATACSSIKLVCAGHYDSIAPYLTRRLNIGEHSQGTVFSRKCSPAYFDRLNVTLINGCKTVISDPGEINQLLPAVVDRSLTPPQIREIEPVPKPMNEICRIIVSECARTGSRSAATLYVESLLRDASGVMFARGITFIDVLQMEPNEIESTLRFARSLGVALDYHAPWLSRLTDRGPAYPTPLIKRELFAGLTRLAAAHLTVFGKKPQVTVHMSGDPEDWKTWLNDIKPFARVLVENAYTGPRQAILKLMRIDSDYRYFLYSDFSSPAEFVEWMGKAGLREVCFDQAHAFGGFRKENGGIFDPIGDLKFLKALIDAGLRIRRMHRSSVPRHLAGGHRESMTLEQMDTHGRVTPFSREWFNRAYPEEKRLIDHVFSRLRAADKREPIKVTFEVVPEEAARESYADLETTFS